MNVNDFHGSRWFCSETAVSFLHVCMIALLGLACYGNTFSVPFMFDDFSAIVGNPEITGSRDLWDVLLHGGSRRIADISFIINHRLHALQLPGYHVVNLAIHISAAVTLYALTVSIMDSLKAMTGAGDTEQEGTSMYAWRFLPLAAALVFVCHPLQTQAVTYIVQRHTSLATLFYLLALLGYLRWRIAFDKHGFNAVTLLWLMLLLVTALLAFHTKQMTYTLPLMIAMFEYFLFRGRLYKQLLLVTGLVGMSLLITMLMPVLNGGSLAGLMFDLRHATSESPGLARWSYFITQIRVVVTYLRLLVVPVRQNLDYDYPLFESVLDVEVMASLLLHFALLGAALFLYRRSEHRCDPPDFNGRHCLRLISLGIAWFYVALMIESSFIPITDVIMEHRVYLPSVGFCIALSAGLRLAGLRFGDRLHWQWCVLASVCLSFSLITVARNHVWSDELRFWQDVAEKSPGKGRVIGNLGIAYLKQRRYETALRLFVEAIRRDIRVETAWSSLGWSLKGMDLYRGRFLTGDEFITRDRNAGMRWYKQKNSSEFNNMGLACEYLGQPDRARKWYVQSVSMNPDFDLAWFNLGLLSARLGDDAQRDVAERRLKMLNPGFAVMLSGWQRKP